MPGSINIVRKVIYLRPEYIPYTSDENIQANSFLAYADPQGNEIWGTDCELNTIILGEVLVNRLS